MLTVSSCIIISVSFHAFFYIQQKFLISERQNKRTKDSQETAIHQGQQLPDPSTVFSLYPHPPHPPPPNHYSVMVAVHNVYNSSKQEALFPAVFVNIGTNQTIGYFYLLHVKKRVIFVKFW